MTILQVGLSFREPQTSVISRIFVHPPILMLLGDAVAPTENTHCRLSRTCFQTVCEFSVVFCNIQKPGLSE